MKNLLLSIIVVVLALTYMSIRSFSNKTSLFNNDKNIKIKNTETGVVIDASIEEYLVGVLAGEMPASFNIEALKAQAIASRTYAYYKKINSNKEYDVTTDKTTQVYISEKEMRDKWQEEYSYYINKIKKAIKETTNKVLTYNNKIIPTYYFSMSNGYTESAVNVFNEEWDYLVPVVSKEDTTNRNYEVTTVFSKSDFINKLNLNCNLITIENVIRNSSNRVDNITICNKNFSGIEIRKILDLRSTDFEIKMDDNILITTIGYGHGVGMSQYGANTLANEGADYKEILNHYYVNTKIVDITSIK